MSQDPQQYYFELPSKERPDPHHLYQFWYPGVQASWARSTSSRAYDAIFGIEAIVIHATAGSSSFGAMSVMKGGGASWHWLVPDENEKAHGKFAWACAPEARAAWHVRNGAFHPAINAGRKRINHWSLGIEVVNSQSEADKFSDWQMRKTADLVRYAWAKYPNLKYVFSHAMVDPDRRSDPGIGFDWANFKSRVLGSGLDDKENISAFSGFEDVIPFSDLEIDDRDSVCGSEGENERVVSSFDAESMAGRMGLNIDWQRAHRYALASQAVYGSEDEAKAWAKTHLEADETVFLSRGNTQLIIAENLSELSIIYRGSQQFGDWIANMKIRKTRRPYGRVHRGFMSAFLDVEAEVMGVIERARRLGKDIYLAGHSLGGALAVITAAEAQSKFGMMKLKGVFTYGMPRTCDAACAEHMTRIFGPIHTRFVNHRDLVTRIPPFSYHTGRLVHFDHSGEIEILDEEVLSLEFDGTEETALSASEFELLQEALSLKDVQAEGQITGASDHAIQNYIDLIAARVRL